MSIPEAWSHEATREVPERWDPVRHTACESLSTVASLQPSPRTHASVRARAALPRGHCGEVESLAPHASRRASLNDNPFSEANFKNAKYRRDHPARFDDLDHAPRLGGPLRRLVRPQLLRIGLHHHDATAPALRTRPPERPRRRLRRPPRAAPGPRPRPGPDRAPTAPPRLDQQAHHRPRPNRKTGPQPLDIPPYAMRKSTGGMRCRACGWYRCRRVLVISVAQRRVAVGGTPA